VDKNAAAVELAKLSLWLETLSGDRPFTFLDHVLRHGDSLVGLDLNQVRSFHWSPEGQLPTVATLVDGALREVKEHRDAIQAMAEDETDAAQKDKRRLLKLASHAMARVKLVADVCVGAFFASAKPKEREAERTKRLGEVQAYLSGDESKEPLLTEWAETIGELHPPFHWHLELPEIFFLDRPDPLERGNTNGAAFMDAFVGNPPFAGKNNIADTSGAGYLEWLQTVHEGAHGNADLSAHFFRRAARLTGAHGTVGLIATNTISQGDTRATGLQYLINNGGFVIYDATRSMAWPGEAAVSVSLVHLAKGAPRARVRTILLDGESAESVNSRLRSAPERSDPVLLLTNSGSSFVGSYVLGLGFVLHPHERDALVGRDPRNDERIFPYLNGQEVNSSPSHEHERYVISFGHMSLAEAESWPDLIEIVRTKVKPERDRNNRDSRRVNWWRFAEAAPALYASIAALDRCLVTAISSKHRTFAFLPTKVVVDQTLIAFAIDAYSGFAVASSRVHEEWSVLMSATIKEDQRYNSSRAFETFPFPKPDPRTVIPELEDIGQRLYDTRAAYMSETQQGLTQTYNKLKDPSCTDAPILHLRTLHEEMDRAVLRAYGWEQEIEVPPFCPLTPQTRRPSRPSKTKSSITSSSSTPPEPKKKPA
jgi:hypothetical protein